MEPPIGEASNTVAPFGTEAPFGSPPNSEAPFALKLPIGEASNTVTLTAPCGTFVGEPTSPSVDPSLLDDSLVAYGGQYSWVYVCCFFLFGDVLSGTLTLILSLGELEFKAVFRPKKFVAALVLRLLKEFLKSSIAFLGKRAAYVLKLQ